MAAVNFELRSYQLEALDALKAYLTDVRKQGARAAFINQTNMPYTSAPFLNAETPYSCLRIPTGGGKTIVAAHAIGVAAKNYMNVDNPMARIGRFCI